MAAGVRTRLRGAGTASDHRAGSSGDFWRRQRLLRDAPARRLQREGPTRTQFPSAPARMAPSTTRPRRTWMNEKSLNFAKREIKQSLHDHQLKNQLRGSWLAATPAGAEK